MKILSVGQLVTDIIVTHVNYARLSEIGDTKHVDAIKLSNGGDAMNVSINLSKLGCDVGFVGKTGSDGFGEFLRSVFEEYNIDIKGLKTTDDSPTSSVIILVDNDGQRLFLYCGGANDDFCLSDIDLSIVDDYSHVHVGGAYLLPGFDGKDCAEFFPMQEKKEKRHPWMSHGMLPGSGLASLSLACLIWIYSCQVRSKPIRSPDTTSRKKWHRFCENMALKQL